MTTRPLDGLDLNLLVTLRALLEHGSVGGAARRLGQSQPTVSRSLASLRVAFRDPLLVRSGHRMVQTELARALAEPLERVLREADGLMALGQFDPRASGRCFRVAMPDLAAALLAAPLCEALGSAGPGLGLRVVGTHRDPVSRLLDGELDLVVARPFDHPELVRRVLATDGWLGLVGRRHPDIGASAPTFEQWLGCRHAQITPDDRPDEPGPIDRHLRLLGAERKVVVSLAHVSALVEVLRDTPCVAVLPASMARWVASGAELRTFHMAFFDELPPLKLTASWARRGDGDAGHRWLRGQVFGIAGRVFAS